MNGQKRLKVREANRMSICARDCCRQLFAVCGRCDRGRRYCSPECASATRWEQLRRAGRQYQQTPRGRSAHAIRQARYRARKMDVTARRWRQRLGAPLTRPRAFSCLAASPPAHLAACVAASRQRSWLQNSRGLAVKGARRCSSAPPNRAASSKLSAPAFRLGDQPACTTCAFHR